MTTSVLLPSYRRPGHLLRCLESLAAQTTPPDEVILVWQGDDTATGEAGRASARRMPFPLRILHSPPVGIVPAENLALDHARGDIIAMIDDDAEAAPNWLERHLGFYSDPAIGAVGGTIANFRPDGTPFPPRAAAPQGVITWFGKVIGNLYDHPAEWRERAPIAAQHLAGGNMSFRREAMDRFESELLPYWQHFEADACLEVMAHGYSVALDFGNVVRHYPTNTVYDGARDEQLAWKVYHSAYNHAFILAKHSPAPVRLPRLAYLLLVGAVTGPGVLGFFAAVARHGDVVREIGVLFQTLRYHLAGWKAGAGRRARRPSGRARARVATPAACE